MLSKRMIASCLFVGAMWAGSTVLCPGYLKVMGGVGERTERLLIARGIPFHHEIEDRVLVMESTDKDKMKEVLTHALYQIALEREVCRVNLANRDTTRTAEGTPFRPLSLVYDENGVVLGISEDQSDFNWVYDPAHPDALLDGPKAGYVAKPNVNPEAVKEQLRLLKLEGRTLARLLRRLDPDIVLGEVLVDFRTLPRIKPQFEAGTPSSLYQAASNMPLEVAEISHSATPLPSNQPFQQSIVWSQSLQSSQASVANALNWIAGDTTWTADKINRLYGYQLLEALRRESPAHYGWRDGGDLTATVAKAAEACLQKNQPVLLAVGEEQGPGVVVMLVKADGKGNVTYADPRQGKLQTVAWSTLIDGPRHPDGNFVFLPE